MQGSKRQICANACCFWIATSPFNRTSGNGYNKYIARQFRSPVFYAKPSDTKADEAHRKLEAMQKHLKTSQQKSRRLVVRVHSMKTLISDLKNKQMLSQQAADNLCASFSGPALDLVMSCLKKSSGKPVRSYPPELRAFALTLQFYSSKAYDYVHQTFNKCLPHPQTISSWYKCINGNPGFHDEVFLALEGRTRGCAGGRMLCSFMMDEIAIRKQLDFDSASDKFLGYVDMGIEIDDMAGLPLANEALLFMIVSLTDSWKVPVAYFLVAGLNGAERANLVKLCIEKLFAVGVDVVSLTFDGCRANVTMAKLLGASLDADNVQSCFPHPCESSKSVSLFLDACHMLKLVRNTLAEKSIIIDSEGNEIKWDYLKELQELQSNEGLRAANKLHECHIQWNRQKMKVKLAAQTLSSSVADAFAFCEDTLQLPKFKNSSATVKFIRIIDRLFDILNSRKSLAKGYKAPIRLENEGVWRPFLLSALQYLMGLKLANGELISNSLRKTGVIGFVTSAQSAIRLFDSLVKQESLMKYLLTYKFSQDHLELFFAVVRSRGGSSNNPSPLLLRATWKRLLTHNHVKDVAMGNCELMNTWKLLTINDSIEKMQSRLSVDIDSISHSRLNDVVKESDSVCFDHDYLPSIGSLSKFVDNVVVYISGFVVRSLESYLSCEVCLGSLRSVRQEDVSQNDFGLIEIKDRGDLISPSPDVIAVCKSAELYPYI